MGLVSVKVTVGLTSLNVGLTSLPDTERGGLMKGEEVELRETKGGTLVELAGVRGGVGLPGIGDEFC